MKNKIYQKRFTKKNLQKKFISCFHKFHKLMEFKTTLLLLL